MNKLIYTLLCIVSIQFINAQSILISQGGTVNVSGGEVFYDAGGAAGNDGNTSGSKTIKIN